MAVSHCFRQFESDQVPQLPLQKGLANGVVFVSSSKLDHFRPQSLRYFSCNSCLSWLLPND